MPKYTFFLTLAVAGAVAVSGARPSRAQDPNDPNAPDSVIIDMACAQQYGDDSLKVTVILVSDEPLGSVFIPIFYMSPDDYWRIDTAYFISDRWLLQPIRAFTDRYDEDPDTAKYSFFAISITTGIPPARDTIATICFRKNPEGGPVPGPLSIGFTTVNSGSSNLGLVFVNFNSPIFGFEPVGTVLYPCDCSKHGDCDGDGGIGPTDVVYLCRYAFLMGPAPPVDPACPVINRGDFDCDNRVAVTDVVKMVNYVYRYPAEEPCEPCSWFDDDEAPAAVTDLAISESGPGAITLGWTAPGDDGNAGTAAGYDIRFSTIPITEENWEQAGEVYREPSPRPAGTAQTLVVPRLAADSTYYFALKSIDEAAHWSGISNVVIGVPAEDFVVDIPDANLEIFIRGTLGSPDGAIFASELLTITELNLRMTVVADMTGLQYCANLELLWLESNGRAVDLNPLAGLSKLSWLHLADNEITDINPLADLTNLKELYLLFNQISDIRPLAGLINLETLLLQSNNISDISPLMDLTQLRQLFLDRNEISDITALAALTNLVKLGLKENNISDVSPLIANSGLGRGDVVWLWDNPLSEQSINEYIPLLRDREVSVFY